MTKNRKDLTPRRISRFGRPRPPPAANIKVVIRIRPPNTNEATDNHRTIVRCNDAAVLTFDPEEDSTPFFFHGVKQHRRDLLKKQNKNLQFVFDRVFPKECSNDEVFQDSTKDLINILMDGCNCSVFVYGATGAGKTFTMLGKPNAPGITVLTMRGLFARKDELLSERSFELFVTYLEVYNENVRDLLKPSDRSLQLREDAQFGVQVANLTHKKIHSSEELFSLLEQGNRNRTQHPTDANAESSRSHAVFQVYIKMKVRTTGQTIMAKLSMIDLAGSERGAATGCRGMRFTEGANINKSLLALGNCINSLADGQRHVPYRDSKLTRILKDSLGGNCHTVMIANVSPSSLCFEDTYNTLKYANRAKKIKLNVKKNVMTGEKSAAEYIKVIEELHGEVKRLKEENDLLKQQATGYSRQDQDEVPSLPATSTSSKTNTVSTVTSETQVEIDDKSDIIKMLYEEYRKTEEHRHTMAQKKHLLEMRIDLKDEANSRLSGFTIDAFDKENGRKRILESIARQRRQTKPYEFEIIDSEAKIADIKRKIEGLVNANPELQLTVESEQTKIEKYNTTNDKELLDSIVKIQEHELQTRGELLERMSDLLHPWYLLLKARNMVTDDMTIAFKNLRTHLLGYCKVKFEDGGDSGLSTTSSSTCSNKTDSLEVKDEQRTTKRKLAGDPTDLDSTYVCGSSKAHDGLFKEYQPSPAKRFANAGSVRSSPRLLKRLKENKSTTVAIAGARRPIGTMGTSSRFPNGTAKAPTSQHQLTKRPLR